jgi:hypothetical protein
LIGIIFKNCHKKASFFGDIIGRHYFLRLPLQGITMNCQNAPYPSKIGK